MRNVLLFLLLSITLNNISLAANKWALLVGVSHYPKANGWNDLAADNDVDIVKEALNKQGFSNERIKVLKDEKATKAGIIAAFNGISLKIQKGDIVVFLFSGHGQRIADQPPLDEADGYDEAIVPYDAPALYEKGKNEGAMHILDDELWRYFSNWRCQLGVSGQLITLFDACYAGTATRAMASRLDRRPLSILADKTYIEQMRSKPVDTHYQENSDPPTCDNANWATMISFFATMPDEMSRQIQDEKGTMYGPLCYAFAKNLPKSKSGESFRILLNRIAATMASLVPFQHPTAEGDLDAPIFNFGILAQKRYFDVSKINASDAVTVNIGALGGVGVGTTVAFDPAETMETTHVKTLLSGKTIDVLPQSSVVKLEKTLSDVEILRGAKVFIKNLIRQGRVAKVQFSTTDMTLKKAFVGKLLWADLPDADLILDIKTNADKKWAWSLKVPEGLIFDAAAAVSLTDLTEQVTCRIYAFEQGRFLREWTEEEEALDVDVALLPCATKDSRFEKLLDNRPETTPQHFKINDTFVFRITNRSKLPVYVQIIDIEPSNSLNAVLPAKPNSTNDPIGAGKSQLLTDFINPIADPTGNEVLKIIVSTYHMMDMFSAIPFKTPQTPCVLRGAIKDVKEPFTALQNWLKPQQQAMRSATLPNLIAVKTVHFVIEK